MVATVNRIEHNAASIGDLFHKAALASQAVIDAIPDDADVRDEDNIIRLSIAPVDELAHLILRTQKGPIRMQALAWLDGCYWTGAKIAA
jgi:hypothetical protein